MSSAIVPVCAPDMDTCDKKCRIAGALTSCNNPCGCYDGGEYSDGGCFVDDIEDCPGGGDAGGQGSFSKVINVGSAAGTFEFSYEAYTIPDSFTISGAASYSTGSTSGSSTVFVTKDDSSAYIIVTVEAPLSGTAWVYSVGCVVP